jgi:hypothetical protein
MHVSLCIHTIDEPYNSADNLPLPIRQQLLSLFHQYGVEAAFSGHTHTNKYVLDGDLEIITTTSTTCGLGSPPTTPAITIIKVYSDHIVHELRTLDSLP